MKVKDARAIINLKKRGQQQLQKRNSTTVNAQIVDARQILKSKRKKDKLKFTPPAQIPTALVKKELTQVLKSVADQGNGNKNKKRSMFDKRVEFAKSGLLTITSKGPTSSKSQQIRKLEKSHQSTDPEKLIVNNRKSIVVVKPNEFVQQHTKSVQEPMDFDQDDLENMTLDDFPDIKTLPRGLSSSLKTSFQSPVVQRTPWKPGFSSIANEMNVPVNTMVADTVQQSLAQQGYTVFVSNLHDSVTQEDVIELFSDVGPLANAQLLQPGSALVVYFTKAEASQACDSYHNRLLDGQPMQCSLLPSSAASSRSSLSSRLGGKLIPGSSVLPTSPSVSTFQRPHLPASVKSSSQRSVQFTVKLP